MFREPQRDVGSAPRTTSPRPLRPAQDWVLQLQHSAGNQAVARLLQGEATLSAMPAHDGPSGEPLEPATRRLMESRLGHDFSGVRVHTDQTAARSARRVGAQAYTVGDEVVLGSDAPALQTKDGQRVLAHELSHVVQQRRGGPSPGPDGALAEREADSVASAMALGQTPAPISQGTAVGIARSKGSAVGAPPAPAAPISFYSETPLPDGRVEMRAWGKIGEAIARPGLEKKYPLPKDVGLTGHARWHLAGPDATGAEHGIAYAPTNFNVSKTAEIENLIRRARAAVTQQGGALYFDFRAQCKVVGEHEGVQIRVLEKVTWKVDARPAGGKLVPILHETATVAGPAAGMPSLAPTAPSAVSPPAAQSPSAKPTSPLAPKSPAAPPVKAGHVPAPATPKVQQDVTAKAAQTTAKPQTPAVPVPQLHALSGKAPSAPPSGSMGKHGPGGPSSRGTAGAAFGGLLAAGIGLAERPLTQWLFQNYLQEKWEAETRAMIEKAVQGPRWKYNMEIMERYSDIQEAWAQGRHVILRVVVDIKWIQTRMAPAPLSADVVRYYLVFEGETPFPWPQFREKKSYVGAFFKAPETWHEFRSFDFPL